MSREEFEELIDDILNELHRQGAQYHKEILAQKLGNFGFNEWDRGFRSGMNTGYEKGYDDGYVDGLHD